MIGSHIRPGSLVLDIGSRNVNGSVRSFLSQSHVFGIDVRDGNDVDRVIDACDFDGKGEYDAVVCAETLEHAPDPKGVIDSAWRALRPGGVFITTAAAPEREPHNCNGDHGEEAMGDEHYAGIKPSELDEWLREWDVVHLGHDPAFGDVRATARKPYA